MITAFLDRFEAILVSVYGERVYQWGPLSPLGSVFNVGVAGVLLLSGVVLLFSRSDGSPFFLIAIAAILLTVFGVFAARVYTGRTLRDREFLAEMNSESPGDSPAA